MASDRLTLVSESSLTARRIAISMKPINMRATMNNIIATTITEILAEQQFFLDPTQISSRQHSYNLQVSHNTHNFRSNAVDFINNSNVECM